MKKKDEIEDKNSCFNKAKENEMVFVLREKDEQFADSIRLWAFLRYIRGDNFLHDKKIISALMEAKVVDGQEIGPSELVNYCKSILAIFSEHPLCQ